MVQKRPIAIDFSTKMCYYESRLLIPIVKHKKGAFMKNSERELAQFLEAVKNKELATWERQRTSEEMSAFVLSKLAGCDDKLAFCAATSHGSDLLLNLV